MASTTVGTIQFLAKIDTSQYKQGASEIERTNSNLEKSGDKSSSNLSGSFSKVAKVGMAAIASAAIAVGTLIVSNIDNAIKRVDALESFPKVLKSMGISAKEASSTTALLNKSLIGLPTSLNEGASGVQQFIAAGMGSKNATRAFLAMNNALLASGGNAQATGIVMESLTRALAGGSAEATTIQAALSRMPTALKALQKETGKSADELYNLYAANPQMLIDDLIKLNEKGGGAMESLDKQARAATGGIGTSFDLMNTKITRGIAKLIEKIDSNNISSVLNAIGSSIETTFKVVGEVLVQVADFIKPLTDYIAQNKEAWEVLKISLIAIGVIIGGIIILVGVGLIGAFALLMGIINIVVWAVRGLIDVIVWLGTAIGNTMYDIASFFYNLPGNIKRALGDAGSWLYDVGKNIVKGLINGLNSMIETVKNTAANIAKGVQDKFKNLMGIHSPSLVFKGYGIDTGKGYINGLEAISSKVNSVISDMVNFNPAMAQPVMPKNYERSGYEYSQQKPSIVTQNFYPKDEIDMNIVNRNLQRNLARA